MKRKLLAGLLCLCMIISILPVSALAASGDDVVAPEVEAYGFVWEADKYKKDGGTEKLTGEYYAGSDWMSETMYVVLKDGATADQNLWFQVDVGGKIWGCAAITSTKNMFAFSFLNRTTQWEQVPDGITVGADKEHATEYISAEGTTATLKVYVTDTLFTTENHTLSDDAQLIFDKTVTISAKGTDTMEVIPDTPDVVVSAVAANLTAVADQEAPAYGQADTYTAVLNAETSTITVTATDLEKTTAGNPDASGGQGTPDKDYWVGVGLTKQDGATYAWGFGTKPAPIPDSDYKTVSRTQTTDGNEYVTMYWSSDDTTNVWSETTGYISVKTAKGTVDYTVDFDVDIAAPVTKHTVTFNLNGGNIEGSTDAKTVQVADGEKLTGADVPTPTHDTKVFKGWALSTDTTNALVDPTAAAVTADVTYKAVWGEPVTTGIAAGFSWKAADANTARNAAISAAGKEGTVNDSLDQTVWFMLNESVKGNHYWFEIADSDTPDEPIWSGAMDYEAESTARGMIAASFLHNGQNEDDIVVPAELVVSVWKTDTEVTERPATGTPVTQTITTGTNPLAIDTVTPDVAEKTVKVTFNQDLLGRYYIALTNEAGTVVASTTTECEAPTPAVAKDTGYTFENVTLEAGTYTVSVAQAKAATTGGVGTAVTKTFTLSDTIDSVKVLEGDTESTQITAEVDSATHTITLKGNITNPATKTVKLLAVDADNVTVGTIDTLTLTFDAGEFTIPEDTKLTTILGTDYEILQALTVVETPVAPPATAVTVPADANISDDLPEETLNDLKTSAASVTTTSEDTLTTLVTEAAIRVDEIKNDDDDASYDTATAKSKLEAASVAVADEGDVKVVVQPYLDVQLTGYTEDAGTGAKTLELDISAKYRVVATTADIENDEEIVLPDDVGTTNAVEITKAGENTSLPVSESITLSIELPAGFAAANATLYVMHKGEHYHKGTVGSNGTTLTFTSDDGLSPFQIDASKTDMEAKIGNDYYETLAEAIAAVAPDGTIILLTTPAETTVTGVTKTINFALDAGLAGPVELTINNSTVKVTKADGGTFTYTAPVTPPPVGPGVTTYAVKAAAATNGKVKVSPTSAAKGATVTVTVTPDDGYVVGTVTAKDADGNDITITAGANGKYTFVMPGAAVTVTATFVEEGAAELPFTDLNTAAWYMAAVRYAYTNGLVNGIDAVTFGPDNKLERGQLVTMLWRAEGTPTVTGDNTFSDVNPNMYYADAIAWAAENDIVTGYEDGTAKPSQNITRAELVVILYRYAQYKGMDVTATDDLSKFTDASTVPAWALTAMQWAVGEGVVNGMEDSTIAPTADTSRAQVAQMLMNLKIAG